MLRKNMFFTERQWVQATTIGNSKNISAAEVIREALDAHVAQVVEDLKNKKAAKVANA